MFVSWRGIHWEKAEFDAEGKQDFFKTAYKMARRQLAQQTLKQVAALRNSAGKEIGKQPEPAAQS